MDSGMSTAAFMHRTSGSSSASSTGTGSSGSGGPGNPMGGGRMAVIGVTRNVRLRRRGASGFGFSLRGGREYAAGFYVSDVQPGGEAHRNGLRVGDQIIRVNGYPVEDAVHQEVALLAKNQQVLVLKIRSVGMIPVKDNPNDPVTWHMVQQQQQQLQYNETGLGTIPSTEVRIRILVGEKGRLGCGVCRGIVPGLTVQGTREGGPARAAGLKAGDVIIWCNGQRLTDLPFERAIEAMRSSAVLDLVVQRLPVNHLYDCPEPLWTRGSSGYDSETSSLVNASPPPPPQQNHHPSSPQHHRVDARHQQRYSRDDAYHRNGRVCCPLALSTSSCSSSDWNHVDQGLEWSRKANNTTVIRVNQNENQNQNVRSSGGDRHRSMHANPSGNYEEDIDNEPLYDPVAPRSDYEVHDFDANPRDEANRRLAYRRDHIGQRDVIYDGPADDLPIYRNSKDNGRQESHMGQRQAEIERKTITTVEVHQSVCPPAPPPPLPYKWPAGDASEGKPMNAMGMQMGSRISMGSTGSTETESSLESSCGKDSASTSSSLSTSSCEPASTVSFSSGPTGPTGPTMPVAPIKPVETARNNIPRTSPIVTTDLGSAIAQELQRRAQQRLMNNAGKAEGTAEKAADLKKPQNTDVLRSQEQKITHDKLMEEFKRAHRKMFSNAQQRVQFSDQTSEQEQEKRETNGSTTNVPPPAPPAPPAPPPPVPISFTAKGKNGEDSVEMQSIESFKLKESPNPVVPKPPPTYFPVSNTPQNGSPRHSTTATKTLSNGKEQSSPVASTNEITANNKPSVVTPNGTVTAPNPGKTGSGKVAIRIGAYEGEAKQPSKLDFLSQQSRTNDKNGTDELTSGPVVSRLQNELVATLQRSNLRKKTEGENQSVAKTIPEMTGEEANSSVIAETEKVQRGNVEKLATVLGNRVTIKVNPENGSR